MTYVKWTAREVGAIIAADGGATSHLAFGNLLDELYRAKTDGERLEICVEAPPNGMPAVKGAYLAALIEHLLTGWGVRPPVWVNEPRFFLRTPFYYDEGFSELRSELEQTTLAAFRRRNVYAAPTCLMRA